MPLEPHRLVFIDETAVTTEMTRLRGRSARGRPAAFELHIETQLAPTLQPGDVVIADNLSSHKSAHAQESLKSQGNWLLYLPPYSPELILVEIAYSKLKAHLRRLKTRTFEALFQFVAPTCDLFPPDECRNLFKAAVYVAD